MPVPGKRILDPRTLAIGAGLTEDEPVKSDKTPPQRRRWTTPKLTPFGSLATIVQTTNPGKPSFGKDGGGMGGGEEMFMS